jgi:hypothetical protein
MEACGFKTLDDVSASKFFRKVDTTRTLSFQDIYFKNTGKLNKKENAFAKEEFFN